MSEATADQDYPGQRLGLPPQGSSGSIATFGRRIAALVIDLACAALIGLAFFDYSPWATNLVFAAVQIVFIPTLGGSPGHRIMGLYLVRVSGGWVGVWRPIIRTALLFLVIPAVVADDDHRGLHDKAAGTMLLRR
ncbi:RDD family protein [Microbacterium halophytorum]|uniref:RDD family protein n=1 Tax=Microbacterium halophytorum TaxID=2067568 RepID=UPI0015741CA5|nr:RDD family protein [Microbacterium halophytorum]